MIRSIARQYLAPLLKSQGFRKNRLVWNRHRGEFVDVITLQKAGYSTSENQTITGNAGVFISEFYEVIFGNEREIATEADCVVRARFGEIEADEFSGKALDHWWNVTPNNVDSVGIELFRLLQDKVLPILDTLTNYAAIEDHLNRVGRWQNKLPLDQLFLALVRWKNGNITGAREVMDVASRRWPEQADNARRWMRK